MTSNPPSPTIADPPGTHAFLRGVTDMRPDHGHADLDWLREVARRVQNDPAAFLSWLDAMVRNEESVRDAAKRSYWHPNGFAKMVLHTCPEFRIRLHVWPEAAEPSRGESNPHSHRWEFASTLIAGKGMHMVEYTETTDGGKPHKRYWYGTDPANPAALAFDGEARLKKIRSPHVWRGDVYTCDTAIVHTVRPVDAGLTATVVIQGPHLTPQTVVYCEPGQTDDQPNGELTEKDFRELVGSVMTAFESGVKACR